VTQPVFDRSNSGPTDLIPMQQAAAAPPIAGLSFDSHALCKIAGFVTSRRCAT
jgi:hypothetical protein